MHITAMKVLRPGMYEYEVVAEMNRVAESNNCELSFATIATINGQTLHNHYHGNKVKPGDLFLIDAGAEVESGYAGDMSSTIPADKKFTPRQRKSTRYRMPCIWNRLKHSDRAFLIWMYTNCPPVSWLME